MTRDNSDEGGGEEKSRVSLPANGSNDTTGSPGLPQTRESRAGPASSSCPLVWGLDGGAVASTVSMLNNAPCPLGKCVVL